MFSQQGKPVLLKPYIVGQVVENMDENMVSQVGAAMASLHEIPNPHYLPGQHAYGLETFPRVMGKGINLEYENWLAQRYDFLMQTIPSGLPRGLIHGDVFYDNVLFDGKKFKAIIDFKSKVAESTITGKWISKNQSVRKGRERNPAIICWICCDCNFFMEVLEVQY